MEKEPCPDTEYQAGLSDWHKELEIALYHLDDAKIQCVNMSLAISCLLADAGVEHFFKTGGVVHRPTGDWVVPHACYLQNV